MRRRWLLSALTLTLALAAVPGSATAQSPARVVDRVDLPTGWQPEGITVHGRWLYVGSLADGRIIRADVRTGRTKVLPQSRTGKPAVGIDYDQRRDVLWVAGGDSGEIRAQSARTGRVLGTYRLPKADARFVNDVVVTRRAVYATDSVNQELGVVRLAGDDVPRSERAGTMALRGDIEYVDGFNANGIVKSGRYLVLVQSNTGTLFRVDKASGVARDIDAGGYEFTNGDGLEPDGRRLHVVRNDDNLVVTVQLRDRRRQARVVTEQTSDDLDVPTTVALRRGDLWAVNARFGNAEPAEADYWVTRLDAPAS